MAQEPRSSPCTWQTQKQAERARGTGKGCPSGPVPALSAEWGTASCNAPQGPVGQVCEGPHHERVPWTPSPTVVARADRAAVGWDPAGLGCGASLGDSRPSCPGGVRPRSRTCWRAWLLHCPGCCMGTEVLEAAAHHCQDYSRRAVPTPSRSPPSLPPGAGPAAASRGTAWTSSFFTADPRTSCRAWQRGGTTVQKDAEDSRSPSPRTPTWP